MPVVSCGIPGYRNTGIPGYRSGPLAGPAFLPVVSCSGITALRSGPLAGPAFLPVVSCCGIPVYRDPGKAGSAGNYGPDSRTSILACPPTREGNIQRTPPTPLSFATTRCGQILIIVYSWRVSRQYLRVLYILRAGGGGIWWVPLRYARVWEGP